MSKKRRSLPQPAPWDPESGERPLLGAVDEGIVDAPSRQTLLMLGILCASTLVMWAAGRAACNYHVPGEGLTPRAVSLEDKARDPKGVAIEFAQALSGADFETAGRLAAPSAQGVVAQAQKACGSCSSEKAARENLLSVPEVISVSRTEAYVAVTTTGGPAGEQKRVFHVERATKGDIPWQVTQLMPGREGLPAIAGALPPRGATVGDAPSRAPSPHLQGTIPLRPGRAPLAPGEMPDDATHRAVLPVRPQPGSAPVAPGTSPGSAAPPSAPGTKAAAPAPNAPAPSPAAPSPAAPSPAAPSPAAPSSPATKPSAPAPSKPGSPSTSTPRAPAQ